MTSAQRALERLREPDSTHLRDLSALLVAEAGRTPLREIARPDWLASQAATALEALVRTSRARDLAAARYRDARDAWAEDETPLRAYVPRDVDNPMRQALGKPYAPSETLVWRVLDQEVFRAVMAEVLEGALTRFRRRVTDVDGKLFGGLGRRAAKRGRGLLGGVAESVVGAVAEEVEGQVQQRIRDFVHSATGEALRVVARHLADPAHAEAYAEVRIGVWDTFLDTPVAELASELDGVDPMAYVDVLVEALRSELARPDFLPTLERRIERLLDEVGDGSLADWLDEVGLLDVWTRSTRELLAGNLARVVRTDAFATWWESLHA